jgi:ribokinase
MNLPGVTVVGSANADLVLPVAHLPLPGETVLASGRRISPGGKGLNQAVAAARAGCRTRFVAALGDDAEGTALRAALTDEDIVVDLRVSGAPTGLAVVMVDGAGENSIVVVPGANAELCELTTEERAAITDATVLLMQLEIPLPTVARAARIAHDAGATVVLNAAPATTLDDELLGCVDVLIVNEGEARALVTPEPGRVAGVEDRELDELIDALLVRVPTVVVTLGARGAVQRGRDGSRHSEPGRQVTVVDTTGAGDTFAGYLAAALAAHGPMPEAMRRASAAAALCVQRPGAVPAVPRRDEVDALLLDPLVPRPIDQPTAVPLDRSAPRTLDDAKIFAAPDDPS